MKPSVTKLIGLLDKPALMKWANTIGLQGISLDEHRKKAFAKGISFHGQIENYLKNQTPFTDELFFGMFKDWLEGKEIISFEKEVEGEKYQGRFDIKFRFNNEIYIADFKSRTNNVYFENKLQLAAYKLMDGCDKVAIVSVPDMKVLEVDLSNIEPYEKILDALSVIYNIKAGL